MSTPTATPGTHAKPGAGGRNDRAPGSKIAPPAGSVSQIEPEVELNAERNKLSQIGRVYKSVLGKFERLFHEPDVIEIRRMPDDGGRIWIRRLTDQGQIAEPTEFIQKEPEATVLTQRIAYAYQRSFNEEFPTLRAVMPLYNLRFTALRPPLTNGVFWTVRRKIVLSLTLEDYLNRGQMTQEMYAKIIRSIRANQRFAIVGPQSVGKTVFASTLLQKVADIYPFTFFVLLEDVSELYLNHPSKLYVMTQEELGHTVGSLMPLLVRTGAESLSPGEVSTNAAAVIEAFTIGVRRTSIFTVHGEAAKDAYLRLEEIHHKENSPVVRSTIQKAVQKVIVLDPNGPNGLPLVRSMWRISGISESTYNLVEE